MALLAIKRVARAGCLWTTLFLASAPPADAAVFSPETYRLANGLEIVVVKNTLTPAVASMVWYKVGAMDEPAGKTGLAHFLEHMMFKGTETVPEGTFSALIASRGGDENAFTSHDATAYYETMPAHDLVLAFHLEADRMRNLRLDPAIIEQERQVILSERQERTENTPQGLFAEKLRAALFEGHPYGRPVIGWQEDLRRLTPADLQAFYRQHYAPDQAVLVVSGDVRTEEVLQKAAATFGRLPPAGTQKRPDIPALSAPRQKRLVMEDARVTQPYATKQFIVSSLRESREESYALEVLAEALGGGEVGVLYRHFVLEKRQASSLSVDYSSFARGPALFAVSFSPSAVGQIEGLDRDITHYMKKLARQGLSQKTIQQAKQRLVDSAVFARDSLTAPAQILGRARTTGVSLQEVEQWPDHILAVTQTQVNEALRRLVGNPYSLTGFLKPGTPLSPTPSSGEGHD